MLNIWWKFLFGSAGRKRSKLFLFCYFIWTAVSVWFCSYIIGSEMDAARHLDHVWFRIWLFGSSLLCLVVVPVLVRLNDLQELEQLPAGLIQKQESTETGMDDTGEEPGVFSVKDVAMQQIPTQDQLAVIARCKAGINYILQINDDEYADLILFPLNDQLIRTKLFEYYVQQDYRVNFVECRSGLFCIILRKRHLRHWLSLETAENVEEPKPVEVKAKAMGAHA